MVLFFWNLVVKYYIGLAFVCCEATSLKKICLVVWIIIFFLRLPKFNIVALYQVFAIDMIMSYKNYSGVLEAHSDRLIRKGLVQFWPI